MCTTGSSLNSHRFHLQSILLTHQIIPFLCKTKDLPLHRKAKQSPMNKLMKAVKEVVAPDPLSSYKLSDITRHAGHRRLLKAVDAVDKSTGEQVTVMICSFPYVEERCGGAGEESRLAIQLLRDGAQMLTRVKHPGVVRVLLAPTDDKARKRFVYVTEHVDRWASADAEAAGSSDAPSETHAGSSSGVDDTVSRVETSFGMLQVGSALEFLHARAGVLLLQFSPASIVVTASGDWKLADMTFAIQISSNASLSGAERLKLLPQLVTKPKGVSPFTSVASPELDFCAPEVVRGYQALAKQSESSAAASASGMPDLFSDFQTPSSTNASHPDGPSFPDSDVFGFIATTALLVEKKRLLHSGGETDVYLRQVVTANETCKRLFPSWGSNPLTGFPRIPLGQILQTETFAARELKLLSELPLLAAKEPRDKLVLLKGFHDEISRGAFSSRMLQLRVIGPLIAETEDERMIKYILPILLEVAFFLSSSEFDASVLRRFVRVMCDRAIAASKKARGEDPVGDSILAQLMDKFHRFWKHLSNPKDVEQVLRPLLCAGLCSTSKDVVKESLRAMCVLLDAVERPFSNGDIVAREILSGVIACPEEAPRCIRCLQKLLPCTTRQGREVELEPKLVAGLQQICETTTTTQSGEVEQLLKVLMSIVSESSVEHVATVTLPLLCPLLVMRHVEVRHHISVYVNQLVQLVVKRKMEEEDQDRKIQQGRSFQQAPTVAEISRSSSERRMAPDTDTTFFQASSSSSSSQPVGRSDSQWGPPVPASPPPSVPSIAPIAGSAQTVLPTHHSKHDDLRDAFGF